MKATYKHGEMIRIVEDFFETHDNAIVTVLDSNDSGYRDTMSKEQFHMFKRDYRDSEYVTYYRLPSEIVVVLA